MLTLVTVTALQKQSQNEICKGYVLVQAAITNYHRLGDVSIIQIYLLRCLGASVIMCLPSAQVMIPESWGRAPHQASCSVGSLLLPLPLPLLVFLSHYVYLCQINK